MRGSEGMFRQKSDLVRFGLQSKQPESVYRRTSKEKLQKGSCSKIRRGDG